MAAKSFATDSINVRELFEDNSVDVVRQVHTKVNHDIERKREELRLLVGESYRDLIAAADIIGTMKSSSFVICKWMSELRGHLKGFPKHMATGNSFKVFRNQGVMTPKELDIAAELKLAVEAPRCVRLYLNSGRIIESVHIFLFVSRANLLGKPYHWSLLENSKYSTDPAVTIKASIWSYTEQILQDNQAIDLKIAECIVAQQVLGDLTCEEILKTFFEQQLQNCKNALESRCDDFLSVATFALRSLHAIFIDPQLYSSVAKQMRKPKIQWSSLGISFFTKFMEQFNNENIDIGEPARVSRLADMVIHSYIQPLKLLLEDNYKRGVYLSNEKSLEEMTQYRELASSTLRAHCEDVMRIILGTTKSLWSEVFLGVFHLKCKAVVRKYIQQVIQTLQFDVFPRLQKLNDDFDVISFVWTPTSLDDKEANTNDELKLKSISPHVASVNNELEQACFALLRDSRLLGDIAVKDFMSEELVLAMDNLLQQLQHDFSGLFLGRWCSTVPEFCPSLWKLLKQNDSSQLRNKLVSVSETCCSAWTDGVMIKFQRDLENWFALTFEDAITKSMGVGEKFTTTGEGGLTPSVRVPLHVSHTLQSILFGICFEFGRVGPQSLPKNVRDKLRFAVGEAIGKLFSGLNTSSITAQAALQFVFDLKYVQWFHPGLTSVIEPSITKLQALIDPFDMDIIGPALTVNLKRCLFENHLTVGLLFSEESHGFVAQNFKTKGNQVYPASNPQMQVPLPLLPI